jgi:hypothetical protein
MQVGSLVQWIGEGDDTGSLGVVIDADDMGFGVHWFDGLEEWYENWGVLSKYVRKLC